MYKLYILKKKCYQNFNEPKNKKIYYKGKINLLNTIIIIIFIFIPLIISAIDINESKYSYITLKILKGTNKVYHDIKPIKVYINDIE